MISQSYAFLATCARGFEPYLCEEIAALCTIHPEPASGCVLFEAPLEAGLQTCLWSRIANKVEILIAECYALRDEDIYALGTKLPLEPWFSPESTFCVRAHSSDPKFKNSLYLALKLKDGIVDQMRKRWGKRASIDTETPDVEITMRLSQRRARVYVELQGQPLNMRGYRRRQNEAPIRETLAASMIAASRWNPAHQAFIDPMCGSGTFAIEAALMATQTPPGIQRHFGFERWPAFPDFQHLWKELRCRAKETSREARKRHHGHIQAMDIDDAALDVAQNNAQTAGVSDLIDFRKADVLKLEISNAAIVTNPPYGERITVGAYELPEFYYQLGRVMRTCVDSTLTIISTAALLKKNLHMRPEMRIQTYNGPLECEVARYVLGKGTQHG